MKSVNPKFNRGDLVRVADNLGKYMPHFQSGCDAIVLESSQYRSKGGLAYDYTLHIKGSGFAAWYYESQLTLIKANQIELLNKWENEKEKDAKEKSDIDWIFNHGKEVFEKAYGPSLQALADCLNIGSLWGSHGEGIDYMSNCLKLIVLAEPFLLAGNKQGWLEFTGHIRSK